MSCCNEGGECVPLEAVVTVDERGQLVLPIDLRDKWGLKGGDKLAVISCMKEGQTWCAALVKADLLTKNVKIDIDIDFTAEKE